MAVPRFSALGIANGCGGFLHCESVDLLRRVVQGDPLESLTRLPFNLVAIAFSQLPAPHTVLSARGEDAYSGALRSLAAMRRFELGDDLQTPKMIGSS